MEKTKEEYWEDLPALKEIRAAIPPHLFQHNLARSLFHLVVDIIQVFTVMYIGTYIPLIPYAPIRYIVWPIYWFISGTVATGLWVLAHECGHRGFSSYRSVNHTVGFLLHTMLLVPYHSWRITHGLHHKYNASMERDQVYIPPEKTEAEIKRKRKDAMLDAVVEAPIIGCLIMWVLGWPLYLFFNFSGQKFSGWPSHFNPYAAMFQPKHRGLILLSDFGLAVWVFTLYYISKITSPFDVLVHFFLPYLWVNFWLVSITYLQHTHEEIPHFRSKAWTFERGSSCTIDRDYGFILNYLHHHIADSHVVHHFFSTMPFYNAVTATPYIKRVLGKYYNTKEGDVFSSCLDSWGKCRFVSADGQIVSYQS